MVLGILGIPGTLGGFGNEDEFVDVSGSKTFCNNLATSKKTSFILDKHAKRDYCLSLGHGITHPDRHVICVILDVFWRF